MTHHYFVSPEHGNDDNSGLEPDVALRSSNTAIERYRVEAQEGDDVLLTFVLGAERITA